MMLGFFGRSLLCPRNDPGIRQSCRTHEDQITSGDLIRRTLSDGFGDHQIRYKNRARDNAAQTHKRNLSL